MTAQWTPELNALLQKYFQAFNDKKASEFFALFAAEISIVDGFSPYRWHGPGAHQKWWKDAETWAKAGGVTGETIVVDKVHFCEADEKHGYAFVAATLTI